MNLLLRSPQRQSADELRRTAGMDGNRNSDSLRLSWVRLSFHLLIYSDFPYVISWHTSCHTVPKSAESRGSSKCINASHARPCHVVRAHMVITRSQAHLLSVLQVFMDSGHLHYHSVLIVRDGLERLTRVEIDQLVVLGIQHQER